MAWASGQLLGPIIAGTLAQTAGWGVMNIVMAVVSASTALMLALTSEKIREMFSDSSKDQSQGVDAA